MITQRFAASADNRGMTNATKCHVCGMSERRETLTMCEKCARPACHAHWRRDADCSDESGPREVKTCTVCLGIRP